MAGIDLGDGYTRIAHRILEEVAKRRFNGTQLRIIMIVWRYTYGFGRKSHALSVSFLAEAIQGDERTVKSELKKLMDCKILKVAEPFHGNNSRKLSFNKYFSQWLEVGKTSPPIQKARGEQSTTTEGSNCPPLEGGDSSPKKERKKILKKVEIRDMEIIPPEKIKFLDTVFLTQEQYDKLCTEFGKTVVDDTIEALDEWQTNKKPSQHKKDHNKTLRVWIKKDQSKPTYKNKVQQNQEQMNLLKQFGQGGEAPHEQQGNLQLARDNQDSFPGV